MGGSKVRSNMYLRTKVNGPSLCEGPNFPAGKFSAKIPVVNFPGSTVGQICTHIFQHVLN